MKIVHYERMEQAAVDVEGAKGVRMRCLIGDADGAPSFTMRQFEIASGGCTPRHSHAYEHEVFVLEGHGVVMEAGVESAISSGTVVFVPPNQEHQFRNTGSAPLKFLCLIPHPLRGMAGSCVVACGCE